MEISQIIPHVESLIFAADRPLPVLDITDLLNNALAFLEDRVTVDQVETAIEAIREKYSSEFYAFEVRESGGGFQFLTKKEYYQTVAQLNGDKFLKRLSTAALETLAIVAYKQPISKGEIEHIRGVSTDYSITKLLEKELIVISGRSETLPGKPLLYTTSKAFMDYFGLNSASDLPKLKEVFEEEGVQPTFMTGVGGNGQEDDNLILSVSENGELMGDILPVIEDEVSGQLELPLGEEEVEEQTKEGEVTELPVAEEEVEQPATESEEGSEEEPAAGADEEDKKEYPDNVIIETIHIEDVVYVPDPTEEEMEEEDGEDGEEDEDVVDGDEEEDSEEEDDEEEDEEEGDEEEEDEEDEEEDGEEGDDEEDDDEDEEDDDEDENNDEDEEKGEDDDHPSHSK